jgi:uncharacterized protein
MHPKFNPRKLSVLNFAKTQASLEGVEPLAQFDRLHEFQQSGAQACEVHFQASGEMRTASAGAGVSAPWLVLAASARLTMVCQRCLGPVEEEVAFEREFRFVESEAQAQIEDEEAEEDVLVLSPDFDLLELVEDELLMDLPASPKHVVCPQPVKLRVADADYQEPEDKPNPFAALAGLKIPKD